MGKPVLPVSVKLFFGVLSSCGDLTIKARSILENRYGPIDYESEVFDFDLTRYYEKEMGYPIRRCFWSFNGLIDPGQLAEIKRFSNFIEMFLAVDGKRKINLDPGYLDLHKVILASVKERAQKIYLSDGIYADPTLYYLKGKFHSYDWTLPDFRTEMYCPVFHHLRNLYLENLRLLKKSGNISLEGDQPKSHLSGGFAMAGLIKELNEEQFAVEVEQWNGMCLVDFWAPWCGPCRMVAPLLEKLAADFSKELKIFKVNVDDNENLARKFGVSAIPTLILFKNGSKIDQLIGAPPAQRLREFIQQKTEA